MAVSKKSGVKRVFFKMKKQGWSSRDREVDKAGERRNHVCWRAHSRGAGIHSIQVQMKGPVADKGMGSSLEKLVHSGKAGAGCRCWAVGGCHGGRLWQFPSKHCDFYQWNKKHSTSAECEDIKWLKDIWGKRKHEATVWHSGRVNKETVAIGQQRREHTSGSDSKNCSYEACIPQNGQ